MREHTFLLLILSTIIFTSRIGVSSTECVPIYLWETSQYSKAVPALKRISQEDFRDILLQKTEKKSPIVVFEEKNLSPEDFLLKDVKGKSVFLRLSLLEKEAKISYLPCVKNPIKAVKQLPNRNLLETSINSIINDSSFNLQDDDTVSISLDDAIDGENRIKMLTRHDKDMHKLYKRFSEHNSNVIMLFTAHHPSWITLEESRSHRYERETTNETTNVIYKNNEVLIKFSGTPFLQPNNTDAKIELTDFQITTENKTKDGMEIVFSSATNKDVKIAFIFSFGGGYWIMNSIKVVENNQEYSLKTVDVFAPVGFSYHCDKQGFYYFGTFKPYLAAPGFQLQAYPESSTAVHKFGDTYDCVGFMSIPIWSGLFITFLLVLILSFGISMMMNIKTMDRFDDPKGKTITISAAE